MFRFARLAATAAIIATGLPLSHVVAQEKSLTVFAAASLKRARRRQRGPSTKATNTKVVVSYAASSAWAKQIEGGAPGGRDLSRPTCNG